MYKETYRQNCENWTRAVFENVDFDWHQGDNEDEFVEAVMGDIEADLERETINEHSPAALTAFFVFVKTGGETGDVDSKFDEVLEFLRVSKSEVRDVDRRQGFEAEDYESLHDVPLVTDQL